MPIDRLAMLKKERSHLLNQYMEARDQDKPGILVRIMDIDEQITTLKQAAPAKKEQAG